LPTVSGKPGTHYARTNSSGFFLLWLLFSLTAFGVSLSIQTFNPVLEELSDLHDQGIRQTVIQGTNQAIAGRYPDSDMYELSPNQLKILSAFQNTEEPILINTKKSFNCSKNWLPESYFDFSKNISEDYASGKIDPSKTFLSTYLSNFSGFLEVDSKDKSLGWVNDPKLKNPSASHLPVTEDEIAITDFKADMYLKCGYRDNYGETIPLSGIDDLIGKQLDRFTICGIFQTLEPVEMMNLRGQYKGVSDSSVWSGQSYLNNYAIVSKNNFRDFVRKCENNEGMSVSYNYALWNLSDSVEKNQSLLEKLCYSSNINETTGFDFSGKGVSYHYSVSLLSPFSGLVQNTSSLKGSSFQILLWVISGLLFVLSLSLYLWMTGKARAVNKGEENGASVWEALIWVLVPFAFSLCFFPLVNRLLAVPYPGLPVFGWIPAVVILGASSLSVLLLSIIRYPRKKKI
jgi:hypothetical protein